MPDWLTPSRPLSIAHRGASAYAQENTLPAFALAADLGADMWEVDLHLTADDQIIAFHDFALTDGRAVRRMTYQEIRASVDGDEAPLLSEIISLAQARNCGIYADIKAPDAAVPTSEMLREAGVEHAILGAFDPTAVQALRAAKCPYPIAALIPVGIDPFEVAPEADILHLCWEKLDRPQDLLDDAFFDRCRATGQKVVLWHEEDPARMAQLRMKPVLGICSDRPELVNPIAFRDGTKVVCHRGANKIAPENTLAAVHACFAAGFSHVEIDVHVTADNRLVVLHDPKLDRTTNGTGPVCDRTLEELQLLSAGNWFSPFFAKEKIPTLGDVLDIAKTYGGQLYIELKSAPAQLVWDRVMAQGMQERVFFWSFVTQSLRDMRAISAEAHLMMRRQDFDNLEDALHSLSPTLIEYTTLDDWSEFPTLRELGVPFMIAYGGDDIRTLEKIADARADLVNLDLPFRFAEVCRQKGLLID